MNKKMVLIDGNSILNRAFYGVPELSTMSGLHTNAVYGFLNIMFKILEEEKPEYLAVAFDVKVPTFRHELFEAYKGTRKPMPDELREQVPVIKEVLQAMRILIMEKPGLEADDILGTMARRAESDGLEVSLVSGDRDLLQIASDHIKIRIPKTKGGRTEVEDYYAADVQERYQVTPEQFIELKALMGDASDNIPGVPKIGEKTATELLVTYHTIDNIYHNLELITKKSIKATLEENRNLADLSKVLATIRTDSDLEYRMEDAKIDNLYTPEAYVLCQKLEFKNLLGRFEQTETAAPREEKHIPVTELGRAEEIFEEAAKADAVAFHILEDGKKQEEFAGLALCFREGESYFMRSGGFLTREYLIQKMAELTESIQREGKQLLGFQIKNSYGYLGTESAEGIFDVQLAAYLLNPLKNDYAIEDIANEQLSRLISTRMQLLGKVKLSAALEKEEEKLLEYAAGFVQIIYESVPHLREKLIQTEMLELFFDMEMPLTFILYSMEQEGIRVRPEELKAYGEALNERIEELERQIHEQAGVVFNINSPKQLGEVLFESLGMKGGKKTKTGYSTAADVLDKLAEEHPIVKDILEYRGLTKLKSTYAEGLMTYVGEGNRIHSTFNQTITATGRISSTEPNLQNIPMKMELGRRIRKVFVPKDGYVFVDADYSQIELRILAHMSGDEKLIEAYRMDQDIHRITASEVFHTPFEEVTSLQRRNAKAVNFGIVYGISSFGLSQDLSISRKEATGYIEQYFETYPKVKGFLDGLVAQAKEKGYVTTMFGRRRPIPELKSSNFMQRSFGERVAMNSPIQGTAADIIKIAMIRVYRELKQKGLQSRMILQIHDELLIETAPDEVEQVKDILQTEMKAAADLAVTLEIDSHTGSDWYEVK